MLFNCKLTALSELKIRQADTDIEKAKLDLIEEKVKRKNRQEYDAYALKIQDYLQCDVVKKEMETWTRVIKTAGIKPE